MDQSNKVTNDFIANSLAAEDSSLEEHNPWGVADVNTRGEKVPESGVKGAGGAIFTGFYPYWSKLSDGDKQYIFYDKEQLNIKGGGKRKYFDKKKQSRDVSIKTKKKASQEIQREILYLEAKCK